MHTAAHRCRPAPALHLLVALALACACCASRGPLPPLALSPVGHGGPPARRGPSPVGPLWRANGLSAPVAQGPCCGAPEGGGILCAGPKPQADPYAAALAEAANEENAYEALADGDGGV